MDLLDDLSPADDGVHTGDDDPGPVFAEDRDDAAKRQNPEPASRCHNCDTELLGGYCHQCGQKDQDLDVRFFQLVSEWLGGVFGFDARLWTTLRVLLIRPGMLTLEFLEGRRARYVPPLRLYLVASLLMLLSLSWSGYSFVQTGSSPGGSGIVTFNVTDEDDDSESAPDPEADPFEELARQKVPGKLVIVKGQPESQAEEKSEPPEPTPPSAESEGPDIERATSEPTPPDLTSKTSEIDGAASEPSSVETSAGPSETDQEKAPEGEAPEVSGEDAAREEGEQDFWDRFGAKIESIVEGVANDEKGFNRSFRDYLPQALFLLVPVFALQLWLLFRRRFQRYLFHLIFSLHTHAAIFLLIAVTGPIDKLLGLETAGLGDVAGLAFFVYFFMALRRMYGDSRRRTAAKMLVLLMVHSMMLGITLLGAVILAALKLQGA